MRTEQLAKCSESLQKLIVEYVEGVNSVLFYPLGLNLELYYPWGINPELFYV